MDIDILMSNYSEVKSMWSHPLQIYTTWNLNPYLILTILEPCVYVCMYVCMYVCIYWYD